MQHQIRILEWSVSQVRSQQKHMRHYLLTVMWFSVFSSRQERSEVKETPVSAIEETNLQLRIDAAELKYLID